MRSYSMTTLRRQSGGYTLIELAIVLVVAGMVIAGGASAYRIYKQTQSHVVTTDNVERVTDRLGRYLARFGEYPCPARLDALRTDADYGMSTDCTDTSVGDGTCAGGICIERSNRTPGAFPPQTPPGQVRVRRGAVPFRVLGISEEQSYDGYGSRLMYAVTEHLAVDTSYGNDGGGITILDGSGNHFFTTPQDGAHYVVFSTGPDRKGGYTRQGVPHVACDSNAMDGNNCFTDNGTQQWAEYRIARYSEIPGAGHFDDTVRFFSSVSAPMWRSVNNGRDIMDMVGADTTGKVGVGGIAPNNYAVEVSENILSRNDVKADHICRGMGVDCFLPSKLTDPAGHPDMACPRPGDPADYLYVLRVRGGNNGEEGEVVCTNTPTFTCPAGQFISAVDGNGNFTCNDAVPPPPPVCEARLQQDPCDASVMLPLPQGAVGDIYWLDTTIDPTPAEPNDYTMSDRFECRQHSPVLATWDYRWDNNGVCALPTCIDEVDSGTEECYRFHWWTRGVPGTLIGQVTWNWSRVCPGFNDTWTYDDSNCVCSAVPDQTRNTSCGFGYQSNPPATQTRSWVCDSPNTGYWTGWSAPDLSNCVCQASTETQTASCPEGYVGDRTIERNVTCSGGVPVLSDWVTIVDNCTCPTGQVQTQLPTCQSILGAGNVGIVTRTRTFDCSTSQWTPWADDMSGCTAGTKSWAPVSAPSSTTYPGSQGLPMVGAACSTGQTGACQQLLSGGYVVYSSCQCN
ncbi:MAG: prepilin-type N-terminal cleavage/methylation domain-containing protein [Alphaproteobacteria bacterium]|nr:prepilin-type N-terminal cleavage/methylation domain-containing protein [Alphaproteobacteria bacterium]